MEKCKNSYVDSFNSRRKQAMARYSNMSPNRKAGKEFFGKADKMLKTSKRRKRVVAMLLHASTALMTVPKCGLFVASGIIL